MSIFKKFKKRERTAREKANKAQMGVFARLIGCAYLIYLMITLLKTSGDATDGLNPTLKIAIAVVMLAISVFIISVTVIEFIRNLKSGYYKENTYFSPEERAAYEATLEPETAEDEAEVVDVEYSEVDEAEDDDNEETDED